MAVDLRGEHYVRKYRSEHRETENCSDNHIVAVLEHTVQYIARHDSVDIGKQAYGLWSFVPDGRISIDCRDPEGRHCYHSSIGAHRRHGPSMIRYYSNAVDMNLDLLTGVYPPSNALYAREGQDVKGLVHGSLVVEVERNASVLACQVWRFQ